MSNNTFYTNVACLGDFILERGVEDGRPFNVKHEFKPTLYIPTTTKSKWKTLDGKTVGPIQWGSIKETRDSMKRYENVDNMEIYGHTNYSYAFLAIEYPEEIINYNLEHIKVMYYDIEVGSENGFPDPQRADEEVTAITIKIDDDIQVWGCGEFVHTDSVRYTKCSDERQLLEQFVMYWQQNCPHVITGWNTKIFDTPYLVNRIRKV